MAFGAKAEYSCELGTVYVSLATGDTNPGISALRDGYYQAYIIQHDGANIDAVADYVKGSTVNQIAGEAKITYSFVSDWSYWNGNFKFYKFDSSDASQDSGINIDPYQAYLIAFYGTPGETPTEFCVIGSDSDAIEYEMLEFDDDSPACAKSGWQSYTGPSPVPEPTSGLLMLIGMAGLALKRKLA